MTGERRHRLTDKDRTEVLKLAKGGVRHRKIAEMFGVSRQNIDKLVNRNRISRLQDRCNKGTQPNPESGLSTVDTGETGTDNPGLTGQSLGSAPATSNRLHLIHRLLATCERKLGTGHITSRDLDIFKRLLDLLRDEGGSEGQAEQMECCKDCDRPRILEYIGMGEQTCPKCGYMFWGDSKGGSNGPSHRQQAKDKEEAAKAGTQSEPVQEPKPEAVKEPEPEPAPKPKQSAQERTRIPVEKDLGKIIGKLKPGVDPGDDIYVDPETGERL